MNGTCPNCGHCSHCGRSDRPPLIPAPYYPRPLPWRNPWYTQPYYIGDLIPGAPGKLTIS